MIKRVFAVILALCLLGSLSGCAEMKPQEGSQEKPQAQSHAEPFRICLDVAFTGISNFSRERLAEELETYLEDERREVFHIEDVEVELIPREGQKRVEAIARIQGEIANGGGPDLFLISNATRDTIGEKALFPFPEQAMANGMFLSLDGYIENAQYTDWSELYGVILEAGQTENGQQIVPLAYTLPVTCFRASETEHEPSQEWKWADMVSDETGILQAGALWVRTQPCFYPQWEGDYLEYILGETVDFEKGELLFNEWQLLSVIQELLRLSKAEVDGAFAALPAHYQVCMSVGYRARISYEDEPYADISFYDPLTMVPLYSINGGSTASVVSFAAVNANSGQPKAAFDVIDYLLSRSMQMNSKLYQSFLGDVGMPMHTQLVLDDMSMRTEVSLDVGMEQGEYLQVWALPEEPSDAYRSVVDSITGVRFRDPIEEQLDKLFRACYAAAQLGDIYGSESLQQMVFDAYGTMQETAAALAG